ncbi:YbaK/EbsC family protein [Aquibium sp. A9E412]|uniref:YbaK/EbsC family protein n=1 Tax=Aquibium sp. A9E412 TaxID=2976767 RepID=UPI0025B0B4F9|nr:YbaK/EbsC family protein [Aquibium sp. A9E412]MDN2564648.1 YbaK/EbsC family protein [Aquibium sp. A9E412]
MSKSIERVRGAAADAGLDIEVRRMGASTRTAEEAAAQCGCEPAQIVKSLVFAGADSGRLFLFLVPGDRRLDDARAAALAGENLTRAEPRRVRDETGFAIGGVAPIGHLSAPTVYADRGLLAHDVVWAAAGAHDAVFSAAPAALIAAAGARLADIASAADKG